MDSELVTLTTYYYAIQAETARVILEQAGIRAYVQDSNIVTADWLLGNAVGGVKLQVEKADAAEGVRILENSPRLMGLRPDEPDDEDDSFNCLSCGQKLTEDEDQCPKCGWSFSSPS